MDELLFDKYFNGSLRFLSYRSRSEKEVRDNLLKKKVPEEIIEAIISRLKEHKFLDDAEFARLFLESRLNSKPKALRVIKMELRQKGISEEIIEEVVNDEGLMINDLESARKLLSKKFDKYKNLERNEIYKKLGGFLARRGYDWDTVKRAIDEILEKRV